MKIRYSVDRIVEGTITLIPDDDNAPTLNLNKADYPYAVNDVVEIELSTSNEVLSVTELPDVRDERLEKNKSRLRSLFNKNKK